MRTLIANSSLVTELVVGSCPHQRDGQQDGGAAWATDFFSLCDRLFPCAWEASPALGGAGREEWDRPIPARCCHPLLQSVSCREALFPLQHVAGQTKPASSF